MELPDGVRDFAKAAVSVCVSAIDAACRIVARKQLIEEEISNGEPRI